MACVPTNAVPARVQETFGFFPRTCFCLYSSVFLYATLAIATSVTISVAIAIAVTVTSTSTTAIEKSLEKDSCRPTRHGVWQAELILCEPHRESYRYS